MRVPNIVLSQAEQREVLREQAEDVIEGTSPPSAIAFIIRAFYFKEYGWGDYIRENRIDGMVHDEIGLRLAREVTRQLRSRIQKKEEARARRSAARRTRVAG
jgi:hypothetical protein